MFHAASSVRNWANSTTARSTTPTIPDLFTSPVGGGGSIGKWLKKMLSSARKTGSGGGPPGADNPTHRTDSGQRGAYAVSSLATAASEDVVRPRCRSEHSRREVSRMGCQPQVLPGRLVHGSRNRVRRQRHRRARRSTTPSVCAARWPGSEWACTAAAVKPQGYDIDIDAAVEAHVEAMAGSVPDESVYLDSLRRRRDLSVLLLLDVSGSTAEAGTLGRTVHQQQRTVVANLTDRPARPGRPGGAVRVLLPWPLRRSA